MKRLVTLTLALAVSALSVVARAHEPGGQAVTEPEPGFTSLLNQDNLRGWKLERLQRNAASVSQGTLRLAAGPGWTDKKFADFILRFDVRLRERSAAFTIFVRSQPDAKNRTPRPGYGIRIVGSASDGQPHGTFVVHETGTREFPLTQNTLAERLSASDEWQAFEVTCSGLVCALRVNGGAVAELSNLQIPLGHIGFSAEISAVEFRNIRVRRNPPISDGFAKGAYLIEDDADLKAPTVRHEERPRYTAEALAAKIQGTVLLACVVKEDGSIGGAIAILRSLDSRLGLDREAVEAAKQWRFNPATLNGRPVATLVTIELTFTLGK